VATSQIIIAVASLLLGGGFAQTLSQALKARPEREAVIILPWKELNSALRGQNETLQAELLATRVALNEERLARKELERKVDQLEDVIDGHERRLRGFR
jgi:hypothetical protein